MDFKNLVNKLGIPDDCVEITNHNRHCLIHKGRNHLMHINVKDNHAEIQRQLFWARYEPVYLCDLNRLEAFVKEELESSYYSILHKDTDGCLLCDMIRVTAPNTTTFENEMFTKFRIECVKKNTFWQGFGECDFLYGKWDTPVDIHKTMAREYILKLRKKYQKFVDESISSSENQIAFILENNKLNRRLIIEFYEENINETTYQNYEWNYAIFVEPDEIGGSVCKQLLDKMEKYIALNLS